MSKWFPRTPVSWLYANFVKALFQKYDQPSKNTHNNKYFETEKCCLRSAQSELVSNLIIRVVQLSSVVI